MKQSTSCFHPFISCLLSRQTPRGSSEFISWPSAPSSVSGLALARMRFKRYVRGCLQQFQQLMNESSKVVEKFSMTLKKARHLLAARSVIVLLTAAAAG